jgi:hypothetical protein
MISSAETQPVDTAIRLALAGLVAAIALATGNEALATPRYTVKKVLVAEDQYQGEHKLDPAPLYKPHEVVIAGGPNLWITSNEREEKAGITVFGPGNRALALVNIDEPGLEFTPETEEETIANEEEEAPEPNFDPDIRFNPTVCLPVRLYPGSSAPTYTDPATNTVYALPLWNGDPEYVCAPLGAEGHARHPHGIDMDRARGLVYQVIEHSGLRWNATRSGFEVAETTDEESGMLLVYNVRDPHRPVVADGYLLGHGAHEVAVNERNGKVFQGNHEDSPGVQPNIWVDVIDRRLRNPYGFIDTGFYNAIQGIEVDEALNQVFGTTHVGEKMFAFRGDCVPRPNHPPTIVDYDLDPNVYEPFVEKASGANCILYTVDLREPFLDQVPDAEAILALADTEITEAIAAGEVPTVLPSVLHMHDLTVDPRAHRAYQTLHSIHHAEHTGSPEEAALPEEEDPTTEEPPAGEEPPPAEVEPDHHVMGRWVAEVDVDPRSKTFRQVHYVDLSNGWDALSYPSAEDLPEGTPLEAMFVHAHWVAVDPKRETLLVTGEHTGNLGIAETEEGMDEEVDLEQVLAISRPIAGCVPPVDETGLPVVPEPHVHGVQVDPQTGTTYVSDEGEDCFYESVTILKP